jgi:predicted metalloenzyme YecM
VIESVRLTLIDHLVLNITQLSIVSRAHKSLLKCGRRVSFDVDREKQVDIDDTIFDERLS